MKYCLFSLLLVTLFCQSLAWAEEQQQPPLKGLQLAAKLATYRAAIQGYAKTLQGELKQALQSGGPIAALEVCQSKAPAITTETSEQLGYELARTSLKVRSPSNAPDTWEQAVLEKFMQRQAAGEALKTMEYHEMVNVEGKIQLRYMKAIPTGAPCLLCHGDSEVSADVAAKITELYPEDTARGFKVGDMRGAFSITETLN